MSLDALIMLLGVLVASVPFLGLPESWKTILYVVFGIVLIACGIAVRRNAHRALAERKRREHAMDAAYAESAPIVPQAAETE